MSSIHTHGLLEQFLSFFSREQIRLSKPLLLAVSGGLDSVVLAELCKKAGFPFAIAHCNFGLRGEESDRDASFVRSLSEKYEVKLHLHQFETAAFAEAHQLSIYSQLFPCR